MKVLLCLCVCVTVASAGIIGYPVNPLGYHGNYLYQSVVAHPVTTFTHVKFAEPLAHSFNNFFGPHLVPHHHHFFPGQVVFPAVPGIVHVVPVAPANPKDKGKKKPDDKKDDKDKKEDTTTEKLKKEEEGKSEAEDLGKD